MVLLSFFILLGCSEEVVWKKENNEDINNEVMEFMNEYSEDWEESLRIQNFSMMERFFVPNSQVFHMQRRQHQTLSAERKVEVFGGSEEVMLEVNEFGEYRWTWTERIQIQQGSNITEEERTRRYYISRDRNNNFKITAISRAND